ncbi:hypothetical protein ACHAW5_008009 [Stephanodiscus triporus]|uniref:Glycoside hydrolase family 19 catalytic domain-containing protein n=1 Tax=Stephanodiscus triporus TaxID=2934178 RepID=A0ABD3PKV4_9STRA
MDVKSSLPIPLPRLTSSALLLLLLQFPSPLLAQTGGNLSNCKGGCGSGESCLGNPFTQPVTDDDCDGCAGGKYYWPCNFETLCYCGPSDAGAPRVPPAPKSNLAPNDAIVVDVCSSVLTEDAFVAATGIGKGGTTTTNGDDGPYTYRGLCDAISAYNLLHDEKFAGMGDETTIRAELAAFLANAAVDTRDFTVSREGMHCVDPIVGGDGEVYCKPCREENYDRTAGTCSAAYVNDDAGGGDGRYREYCDSTRQPPQGCACDAEDGVAQADVNVVPYAGYVAASGMYFARGAILNSWNYDYYGAGQALVGDGAYLCEDPDLASTDPRYAWGVGIYKWMEKMEFGTTGPTAHEQAVRGNFGGTVMVLYGELECPSGEWTSADHAIMVRERVARVCTAGAALGAYLEMDACDDSADECLTCDGLKDIFVGCQSDGTCPDCPTWADHVIFVSDAPSVTPVRIQPPEDWGNWNQGSRSDARSADASSWLALSLALPLAIWHS